MVKMHGQTTVKYPYTAFALVDYSEKFCPQHVQYDIKYYGNYVLGGILKKIFLAGLTVTAFRCFY